MKVVITFRWKHKKRDRKWEYNLRDNNNDEDIEDL